MSNARDPVPSTTLVALTPSDMPAAQEQIVAWCAIRLAEQQLTILDLQKSLAIATRNRWGSRLSLQRALTREEKRRAFYAKIRDAVEAGYVVVPNFPVDYFAVRVDPERWRTKSASYSSNALHDVMPACLPSGEGDYVDDRRGAAHTTP